MKEAWLIDLFKAILRVQPHVTGPYRAYKTTRSTGCFDLQVMYFNGTSYVAFFKSENVYDNIEKKETEYS